MDHVLANSTTLSGDPLQKKRFSEDQNMHYKRNGEVLFGYQNPVIGPKRQYAATVAILD
jgi:hypothetical protein